MAPAQEPVKPRTDHRLARHEPIPAATTQEGDQEEDWAQWNDTMQAWESRFPAEAAQFQETVPAPPVEPPTKT